MEKEEEEGRGRMRKIRCREGRGRRRRKKKDERGEEVEEWRGHIITHQYSTVTKASLVKVSQTDLPELNHLMPDLHNVGLQLLLGGEGTKEHVRPLRDLVG